MILKDFTLLTPPLQIKLMDVAPRLDLKFSNTRWSKSSGGCLQTLPAEKEEEEEECGQMFCPWFTPMALSIYRSCSSLDMHFCSRQGPSSRLLD
jgi:hypothetical protein